MSTCEEYCTSHASCVAYNYYPSAQRRLYCDLLTSENSCPSGFKLFQQQNTATSTNDLITLEGLPGGYCYGKSIGKIHENLFHNLKNLRHK